MQKQDEAHGVTQGHRVVQARLRCGRVAASVEVGPTTATARFCRNAPRIPGPPCAAAVPQLQVSMAGQRPIKQRDELDLLRTILLCGSTPLRRIRCGIDHARNVVQALGSTHAIGSATRDACAHSATQHSHTGSGREECRAGRCASGFSVYTSYMPWTEAAHRKANTRRPRAPSFETCAPCSHRRRRR